MIYNRYSFIKPCRAEKKIPPMMLNLYENRGWIAQNKKNGTNSLIYVSPSENGLREVFARTRHDTEHKMWNFNDISAKCFEELPGNGWYVFNSELIHSKTPHIKNTNYLHDIYVEDGEYLIGKSYLDRYNRLLELFNPLAHADNSHWIVDGHLWIARNHYNKFIQKFNELLDVEDEGLVLKDPNAVLDLKSSTGWLAKCRKLHENYSF